MKIPALLFPRFRRLLALAVLAAVFAPTALPADTVMSFEKLRILDQGTRLVFHWSFAFNQLPPTFVLREKNSETIVLNDPQTLNRNLSDLLSVAFDVRIDGQPAGPMKIERLTTLSSRTCTVVMSCPGRPGGHVVVRAPLLDYLPDTYFLYFEIGSVKNLGMGTYGFLGRKHPYLPAIAYNQLRADGSAAAPEPEPAAAKPESVSSASFRTEIRTAWTNDNWLFLCLVLLLLQMAKRVVLLVLSLVLCWVLLCLLWVLAGFKVPWQIPELLLSLPTVLLCVVAIKCPRRAGWIGAITFAAGILNACYDIQQVPLASVDQALPQLTGLSLGFVVGLALVLLVLVPLNWECQKYPGFRTEWAPRICWVVAALAVLVPAQRYFFG